MPLCQPIHPTSRHQSAHHAPPADDRWVCRRRNGPRLDTHRVESARPSGASGQPVAAVRHAGHGARQRVGDVSATRPPRAATRRRPAAARRASRRARRATSARVHHALEPRAVAGPPLADARRACAADEHLAGPEPGEAHQRRPTRPPAIGPSCTVAPPTPSAASAAATCPPSQRIDAPTSAATDSKRGSSAGTTTSNQHIAPGSTSTTPPPLRRLTTSMPARRQASRSTTSTCWRDPSTRAAAVAVARRRLAAGASASRSAAWKSATAPTERLQGEVAGRHDAGQSRHHRR